MKRTLRTDIVLADGRRHSRQSFEIEAASADELQKLADIFAKGVLSAMTLFDNSEVETLHIDWED